MGTIVDDAKYVVKRLVFGTSEVALGVLLFFPFLAGYSYAILLLLGIGICYIISRFVFLASIPFILKHSSIFLDILNATIFFANIFFDLVILTIDVSIKVIDDIITVVNDVSKAFGGHKVTGTISTNWIHFIKIKEVSKAAFQRELISIETTCPAYDSAGSIFYFIARNLFNEFSCPVVRYTYPLPWLYDTMEALLGWSYHGSAAPLVDHPGANCDAKQYATTDYVCVGLGVGYFVLEVMLPTLLLFALFLFIGAGLFKLLQVCFFLLGKAIEGATELALVVIKRLLL